MENLKVGDVVQLKSGSPKMTITAINGRMIETVWFHGNSQMRDEFDGVLLEKPQEKPASGGSIGIKRTF